MDKFKAKNGYVQDLEKQVEKMSPTQREIFLLRVLDSAFGILRPNCMKVKKLKTDISEIRKEILDDS